MAKNLYKAILMKTKILSFFSIVNCFLIASSLQAHPLSFYRAEKNEALANQAAQKSLDLIQQLGSHHQDLNLTNYPEESVRPHPVFSSSYFKPMIERAVQTLNQEERYGVPSLFDPSKTRTKLEEELFQKRKNIIEQAIGDISLIRKSIYQYAVTKVGPSTSATPYEDRITRELISYINQNEPRAETGSKIFDILGGLTRAEIFDSYVTRLLFKSSEATIEFSLSMAITFRTGEDPYFLQTLEHILHQFEVNLENLVYKKNSSGEIIYSNEGVGAKLKVWKWGSEPQPVKRKLSAEEKQTVEEYEVAIKVMREKFQEAQFAHQQLSKLQPEQLDFLISLLLQARKSDIPVDSEISNIIFQSEQSEQTQWDAIFYQQMNRELYKLSDYLAWESSASNEIEKREREMDQ